MPKGNDVIAGNCELGGRLDTPPPLIFEESTLSPVEPDMDFALLLALSVNSGASERVRDFFLY